MSHSDDEVLRSPREEERKRSELPDHVKSKKRNSFVGVRGEWETRKITFMGVVRSFVSQLRIGQDLTKKSMPAIFCNPYSVLEFVSYRLLGSVNILLEANDEEDAAQRMVLVTKWFLSLSTQETLEKKPYNPVLGEVHTSFVESEQYGKTEFLAEQVSHHPPISAFSVVNKKTGVHFHGHIGFAIKFNYNSASVNMSGPLRVHFPQHDEVYATDKMMPIITVRNIIFGTRRLQWENDFVELECEKTSYRVKINWKQTGKTNVLKGEIQHGKDTRYTLEGPCGQTITLYDNELDEEEQLLDYERIGHQRLHYDASHDDMDSIEIWKEVSAAIIANDMPKADECKQNIESAQRAKIAALREKGEEWVPTYFSFDHNESIWFRKT